MNSFAKYEFFFPKKVYCCFYILNPVDQSFQSGEHSLADILYSIINFEYSLSLLSGNIFCTKVGEKRKDCLIICQAHLAIVLLSNRKFLCTSDDEETVRIRSNQKEELFCTGCVKQYFRQMYSYFFCRF